MNDLRQQPDVALLTTLPFWEWPPDGVRIIDDALASGDAERRLQAVCLVHLVMNDGFAERLLDVIASDPEVQVRAAAATALGPALEEADVYEVDGESTCMISHATFERVRRALRLRYHDASTPDVVRRRILEASVRAREAWHVGAVRAAWLSPSPAWQVTAAFAMGFVPGFDDILLEALHHADEDVRYEAIRSSGLRELRAAARAVAACVGDGAASPRLRRAAIDALPRLDATLALSLLRTVEPSADPETRAHIRAGLREARLWQTLDDDEFDVGFGFDGVEDDDLYDDV